MSSAITIQKHPRYLTWYQVGIARPGIGAIGIIPIANVQKMVNAEQLSRLERGEKINFKLVEVEG